MLLACARPHQWVKNLFVLAPLMFSGKLINPVELAHGVVAVLSFCLISSAIYVFNDFMDADADRAHPDKSSRPIASGHLSITIALIASTVMLGAGLSIASFVGAHFAMLASIYLVMTVSYCVFLKHIVILDAMIIACGFVLRLIAGAVAVNVPPSKWLILCAFLLSLYLAFAKRRQELMVQSESVVRHRQVLGEYSTTFLDQANSILVGAAMICYAIYTMDNNTIENFGSEAVVFGNVFVIHGLLRYMALMQNTAQGQDPSMVLIRDRPLMITIIGWAVYNATVLYHEEILCLWQAF